MKEPDKRSPKDESREPSTSESQKDSDRKNPRERKTISEFVENLNRNVRRKYPTN